jgi:PilZ domain
VIHAKITPDLDPDSRRRKPRLASSAEVGLRELGGPSADARLINISSHGFMAETAAELAPGARIFLTLPGVHYVSARVVWVKKGRIGGEFSEPVDPLIVFQAMGCQSV